MSFFFFIWTVNKVFNTQALLSEHKAMALKPSLCIRKLAVARFDLQHTAETVYTYKN